MVDEIQREFAPQVKYEYQLILVNDGSPDDTLSVIQGLCKTDDHIVGIDLSRNYGQVCAKLAGLKYATGDYIIYMDDDGQHPAAGIFPLVHCLEDGADVAFANFLNKKHSWFKRLASSINCWLLYITISKPKELKISSFVAMNRFISQQLQNYKSPFPSIIGYLLQITTKITSIPTQHRERAQGKSRYTLKKLFLMAMNGYTNFSLVPLRIASIIGFCTAALGFSMGIYFVIRKLLLPSIAAGYTSTIAVILFVGGMIMIMLGLLGEYMGRIFMTINCKPQYTVREIFSTPKVIE